MVDATVIMDCLSGLTHVDEKFAGNLDLDSHVLKLEHLFQLVRLTFTGKGSVGVGPNVETFDMWKKMKPAQQMEYLRQTKELIQSSVAAAPKKLRALAPAPAASTATSQTSKLPPQSQSVVPIEAGEEIPQTLGFTNTRPRARLPIYFLTSMGYSTASGCLRLRSLMDAGCIALDIMGDWPEW
jgi:hypothetical protein